MIVHRKRKIYWVKSWIYLHNFSKIRYYGYCNTQTTRQISKSVTRNFINVLTFYIYKEHTVDFGRVTDIKWDFGITFVWSVLWTQRSLSLTQRLIAFIFFYNILRLPPSLSDHQSVLSLLPSSRFECFLSQSSRSVPTPRSLWPEVGWLHVFDLLTVDPQKTEM